MKRTRYKFTGSSCVGGVKRLYWESVNTLHNDSRVEQIECSASFFWSTPTAEKT